MHPYVAVLLRIAQEASNLLSLRVHVPDNWVLGIWAIGTAVEVLGKYMIMGSLDTLGLVRRE